MLIYFQRCSFKLITKPLTKLNKGRLCCRDQTACTADMLQIAQEPAGSSEYEVPPESRRLYYPQEQTPSTMRLTGKRRNTNERLRGPVSIHSHKGQETKTTTLKLKILSIRHAAERWPSYKDEEGEMMELQLRQRGLAFRKRLHLEEETDFCGSGGADWANQAFEPREQLLDSPQSGRPTVGSDTHRLYWEAVTVTFCTALMYAQLHQKACICVNWIYFLL